MTDGNVIDKFAMIGTTNLDLVDTVTKTTTVRGTRLGNALKIVKNSLAAKIEVEKDEESDFGNESELDLWQVRSQHNDDSYWVTNGKCNCKDKQFNGGQECKHELAVMIMKGEEIDGVIYSV
jgi:hypothetical protein